MLFRDAIAGCGDGILFKSMIDALVVPHWNDGVTHVIGVETRGYIFGAPLAPRLAAGFVPVRKAAKRPWDTERVAYKLEYGDAVLEIRQDALNAQSRVVVVDDLMAVGGTAAAAVELCQRLGATVVSVDVVIELEGLGGRGRLGAIPVNALLTF